ncbi:MAG: energy-coupled thiamine transporter ThiT [Clostridia bacterium]|nr:energy-coupled thiamine transporter ThiT [Clostridia bacterium]
MKVNTQKPIVKLTISALFIAMSTVLSLVKIEFPFGGGISPLSMLPVLLIPLMFGVNWGLFACFVNSVIQMLLSVSEVVSWGMTPVKLVACLLVDYILAYFVLAAIGFFRKGGDVSVIVGVNVALFLRLLCHVISGVAIFGDLTENIWTVIWGSITYNAGYMVPEMVATSIAMFILLKNRATKRLIRQ